MERGEGEGEDGRQGEDNMGRWRGERERGEDGRQGEDNMGRWRGERERERMAGKERTTWVGGEGRGRGRGWQARRGQHG